MNTPLQKRIADALSSDLSSGDLSELIEEVETAAAEADAAVEEARARAIDPTVLDPEAREIALATEFDRDRLRAAIPRLQERLKSTQDREYYQRWRVDYEVVKAARDTLADEFRTEYPAIVGKLADLLTRMAASDREVMRINIAAPSGANLHLLEAELEARALANFSTSSPSIAGELRLPDFDRSTGLRWPPAAPPLWVGLVHEGMMSASRG